ncbi:MAG: hypothetical protein AAF449_04275 [Myxococcota bacterium]
MQPHLTADQIRARLAFDVERLRTAAYELDRIDGALRTLKRRLERRVLTLTEEATCEHDAEIHGSGSVFIRYAQAQATAQLARRAALGEVLQHTGRLSLIASMAVSRWLSALVELGERRSTASIIKAHIDAGRIAHRTLATLKPSADLRSGCGQITSAAMVAEFVHPDDLHLVNEQLEEGLFRGRRARGIAGDDDVIAAASRALRTGADLLERMVRKAAPAADELLAQADEVESKVETDLKARSDKGRA